jgi:hypothetical protein
MSLRWPQAAQAAKIAKGFQSLLQEHVPKKSTDFSDILDIEYTRYLVTNMLLIFEIEPIFPDHVELRAIPHDSDRL